MEDQIIENDYTELETRIDLLRQRDMLQDLLELLENSKVEEAIQKIRRNIETINKALEASKYSGKEI